MQQKKAVVPHCIGNGSTGFAIRRLVRQFVIIAKGFAFASGTDTTGKIQLFRHNVFPYPVNRFDIIGITGQRCDVSYPTIQIAGPDSMPHRLALLNNRLVVLAVGTIKLPAVGVTAFVAVLGPTWRIVIASIMAEVISEMVDTEMYSLWIRRITRKVQWSRVLASNAVSIPVDSLIFADEGHGISKLSNRLIYYRRMVEFFNKHLK